METFFWKSYTFLMFSRNKTTFLGTTDIKPWEGCHKCSLEVQRNILGKKTELLQKLFLKNNFRTLSEKLSADLKTAFVVCNGTCWGKSGSPQKGILFVPTLDCEQKTLGRFVKPLLEASRATFSSKKMFFGGNIVYLNLGLRVKNNRPGCQTCFLYDDEKKLK